MLIRTPQNHQIVRGWSDDAVRSMLLRQQNQPLAAATYFPRPSDTFVVNGRTVVVLRPWNYVEGTAYPAMYVLHSYGATPADIKGRFVVDRANNFDDGFVVIAPQATLLDGATPYWNYFNLLAGDFEFFEAFDAALCARYSISWKLWKGFSNGGFMVIQFSIYRPLLVHAAVVMNAASGVDDPIAVTGIPVPILLISGSVDATVLPAGDPLAATLPGTLAGHGGVDWGLGANTGYTSSANTIAKFAARNGLSGTLNAPGTAFDLTTVAGNDAAPEDYSDNGVGTACRRDIVTGGGHGLSLAATTIAAQSGINNLISWARTFRRTP